MVLVLEVIISWQYYITYMNYSQLSGTWAGSDGGKGQERNSPDAETETSVIFAKFVSERIYMFAETQVWLEYLIEICKYLINKEVAFMI